VVKGSDRVLDFISEAGMLKQVKRSGWAVLGIKDAESVADHSFRCAVIGYMLAHMEKASPYKVLRMTLFNDMPEARITDLHKMAQRYVDARPHEDRAFYDQLQCLPEPVRDELSCLHKEFRRQDTRESIIARDADILECLIQAKEYYSQGFLTASKFMKKAPGFLRTKSAKKLWRSARVADLNKWWFRLSDFNR